MSNSTSTVIETGAYTECVAATKAAVQADASAGAKYKKAGLAVALVFPSREAFEAIKAQFCADAIIPALSQDLRNALNQKLPRKGSPEADAFEGLDAAKARLKSARDTVSVYFGRVASYAFPKPKVDKADKAAKAQPEGEGDAADKVGDDTDADIKALAALVTRIGKAESRRYDIPAVLKTLREAQALMNRAA